jgi:aspartate racemase
MIVAETTAPMIGVLGGAGPTASAEFVRTIYEHATGAKEQEYPAVVLDSVPGLPERSVLLGHNASRLLDHTIRRLELLYAHGADAVVICCMTLHHLLPDLPAELSRPVASVVDALIDDVAAAGRTVLMLSSLETRRLGILTTSPRWTDVEHLVVWPDLRDHEALLEAIYDIKLNRGTSAGRQWLERCLPKYGASAFVAGCSEIHVLAKAVDARLAIDPFDTLARAAARGDIMRLTIGHRTADPAKRPQTAATS